MKTMPSVPLLCALLALPLGAAAAPETAGGDPMSDALRFLHGFNKENLLAAAEKMPEAEYGFRPAPEVRSFGEIVGHVADVHYRLCAAGKGEGPPGGTGQELFEKTKKTKAELVAVLRESFEYCDGVYRALTDARLRETTELRGEVRAKASPLTINVYHAGQHYGNLVTYLRIKGLVPPSSE